MKTTKTKHQNCDFCYAKEGKPRPVGNYIVELTDVDVLGTKKTACQSCKRKAILIIELQNKDLNTMKPSIFKNMIKLAQRIASLFVVIAFNTISVLAQSSPGLPGFPDSPSAAPIDGGLGLLAAAGGVYAWKKLRNKNER